MGRPKSLSSPSGADPRKAQDGCWNGQQRLAARLNLCTRKRGCCIKQKHVLNATASFDLWDSHKRDALWARISKDSGYRRNIDNFSGTLF